MEVKQYVCKCFLIDSEVLVANPELALKVGTKCGECLYKFHPDDRVRDDRRQQAVMIKVNRRKNDRRNP